MSDLVIYVIETGAQGYDVYLGFVVAAKSRKEAIDLAAKKAGSVDTRSWSVKNVGLYFGNRPKILMANFNAG